MSKPTSLQTGAAVESAITSPSAVALRRPATGATRMTWAGVRRVVDRIPDRGDIGRAGIARFGHGSGLFSGERCP
ncbi:hypothetical protein [Ilumatobacter sp.]|uniref:hypothetical protein n=1 Tax=Ilumatobacter sp. TaxID=1967498 RepID=UPI003AF91187